LPEFDQHVAQVEMGANVVWLQSDRASETSGSQSRLAQRHQGVTVVKVEDRKVWMDGDRLGNQSRSALRVVALVGNDAEQVQSIEASRLDPEDGLIDSLSLFQLALLVQRQGLMQLDLRRAARPPFGRTVSVMVFDSHPQNIGRRLMPDTQKSSLIPAYSTQPSTSASLSAATLTA
jgi:ligand-binding sensor domain-containing protein